MALLPDAVYVNGMIYTQDSSSSVVSAVSVKDGRVFATGTDKEMRTLGAPEEIDLRGRAVIPGLIDSHMHMFSLGQSLSRLSLASVRSIAGVKDMLSAKTTSAKPGVWILGRGWDQDRFSEKRYMNRYDLDEVSPDNPVALVRSCGHITVYNSVALSIAGVTRDTADVPGGVIDRDASGEPLGIFRERAAKLVGDHIPDRTFAEMRDELGAAMRTAVEAGLTSVHANDGVTEDFDMIPRLYRELHALGERLRIYWDIPVAYSRQLWKLPYRTGAGDEFFKYGALKLLIDGSLGGRTAAMDEDYADDPGNQGVLTMGVQDFDEIVETAHRAGMQVAIHAIGDKAARLSLDAIEIAQRAVPRRDPRHRIVHCQIMTPELYRRFKQLGVVADIQPKFVTTDMLWAEARAGEQKSRTSYAWKTFLDMGIPAAGGSDCPVEPVDPLYGIYAAVTRCDMEGNPASGWMPEQKLSISEAVRLFTLGGAYAAHEEQVKGSIEAGKLADFVVLERDLHHIPPQEIKDVKVAMTVIGGCVAFERR